MEKANLSAGRIAFFDKSKTVSKKYGAKMYKTPLLSTAVIAATFFGLSNTALANQCSEVLKLSATNQGTIETKVSFDANANRFCSDYKKSTGSGGSDKLDIGYEEFSESFNFGFSGSRRSSKSVHNAICKSDDSGSARDNAYQTYVKGVAPLAFSSYNECINKQSSIEVKLGAATPTYVPISVSFRPNSAGEFAVINVENSPEIECSAPDKTRMDAAGSITFNCSRKSDKKLGSITISNNSGATLSSRLSIPWTAYKDGVPLSLQQNYIASIKEAKDLKESLSGSVVAFNSEVCPSGFRPYKPAEGRFIRGIDPDNKIDIDRKPLLKKDRPGSIQPDMVKSHFHTLADAGKADYDGGAGRGAQRVGNNGGTGVITSLSGGYESRPQNVALLYCEFEG